jgi:hypothetical protein
MTQWENPVCSGEAFNLYDNQTSNLSKLTVEQRAQAASAQRFTTHQQSAL